MPIPDLTFEEHCPCGNNIKISGSTYGGVVTGQIERWHRIHDKHANTIAKALVGPSTPKNGEGNYDLIGVRATEPILGLNVGKIVLKTHGPANCLGPLGENGRPVCCIHNPSNHHMVTWEQNWAGDKGIMERICGHGRSHPDPDDLAVRTTGWAGAHDCDGCCAPESKD